MKHLLGVILSAVFVTACLGQAGAITGEISGAVTDPSGASVSGATITATNTGTGFKQSVKTGESGIYRLALLPLGTYDVEAQATGFAGSKHTGIELNVGAVRTV